MEVKKNGTIIHIISSLYMYKWKRQKINIFIKEKRKGLKEKLSVWGWCETSRKLQRIRSKITIVEGELKSRQNCGYVSHEKEILYTYLSCICELFFFLFFSHHHFFQIHNNSDMIWINFFFEVNLKFCRAFKTRIVF